jgi:hypothetical protein
MPILADAKMSFSQPVVQVSPNARAISHAFVTSSLIVKMRKPAASGAIRSEDVIFPCFQYAGKTRSKALQNGWCASPPGPAFAGLDAFSL